MVYSASKKMHRVVQVTQNIMRCVFISCALYALVVPLLMPVDLSQAFAQPSEGSSGQRKTITTPTLSLKMHEKLQKAQALSEANDLSGALAILDELREPKQYKKYSGYEKAMLWSFYAFIYYSDEDYPRTENAYTKVLEQPDLPEGIEVGTRYSLAQIYFVQEKYRDAVKMLEVWFKVAQNPDASAYMLLGQSYYQLKEYTRAIPAVEKAIEIDRSKQVKIEENWYLLLRAMYYDREDYTSTFQILRTLVSEYPRKEYYAQLSALYGELKQEFNQYSTLVAMNDATMLTQSAELVAYAQFLLQNERPYRAAVILERGLKAKKIEETENTYKLLSNAWILAREDERAIPVLESAARLSKTGDIYVALGQSYLNIEDWAKAADALDKAFKKGALTRADTAYVVQGMAYFNLAQYSNSIQAFNRAKKDKRSEKLATQWLHYVQSERDREQKLEQSLIKS